MTEPDPQDTAFRELVALTEELGLYDQGMSEVPGSVQRVADQVTTAISDLGWLAERGALSGVTVIIAERRRQIEQHDDVLGRSDLLYAAETELSFGNLAAAGALLAAAIDGR